MSLAFTPVRTQFVGTPFALRYIAATMTMSVAEKESTRKEENEQ
jgi:hypothetical protein